ncbi:hypothetical protein [Dyadobacter frigoris]|uniref:Prevent-host-death protein n=1 Tax=Dyadobacter frigoris TaxID=2576211 RepID=A0A4U6D3R5_9BACT|nr:hypothetical protein [Dyadobacter frigoris]TKT91959.1 hypothetical protein FDK13_12490 [Dyadobacter frigoris]GLU53169.1 hypothetical protein Dfri01_26300 [Dyadobacter frigoris]
MDLQYISNEHGEKTAVIIPIQEWNNLTAKHEDLKELAEEVKPTEGISQKKKPSDFIGIMSKEEAEEMNNYLKKARGEWDRDF